MFSSCLYCNSSLGKNEAIELFPVGERLAFDPKRGRLWVICRRCERWNLSPLDERWEAIEVMEDRFRSSRLRVSTDNVGMARLREGIDLIRIGDPLRPEMAVWRYGDQFGRRRKRQLITTGAVLGGAALAATGLVWSGIAGMVGWYLVDNTLWDRLVNGRPNDVVARIGIDGGKLMIVERLHARMAFLEQRADDDVFQLRLHHRTGERRLEGSDALRAAAQLLPVVNRFGGSARLVRSSVDLLEDAGDPLKAIRMIQRMHGRTTDYWPKRRATYAFRRSRFAAIEAASLELAKVPGALHMLPPRERLALEMALHEDRERRAMHGELQELTRAWKEAEEIARIADEMFVADTAVARIEQMREGEAPARATRDTSPSEA